VNAAESGVALLPAESPDATAVANWRSAARPDVKQWEIVRANEQIQKLGRLKSQLGNLFDHNDTMFRSYDAAASTKFNADMRGTYTSANSEIISGDYSIRARARTIAKDTPQGKAALRADAINVVGDDPFRLDMRYGTWGTEKDPNSGAMIEKFKEETKLNRAIETEWRIFGQPENFTVKMDMSRMEAWLITEKSAFRDGFVLVRHRRGFPKNKYRYATELLECDRLQSSYQGIAEGTGNPIRFSIEYDLNWNYPVAVWVLARHPGDCFAHNSMSGTMDSAGQVKNFRVRIPIEDVIVFHNLRDRAEQDVGFTELDAAVQSLWRLWQYEKALTYAAIASCMKVFWIKKNFPTGMQFGSEDFDKLLSWMDQNKPPGAAASQPAGDSGAAARQQGLPSRTSTESPGSTLDMEYGMELMQTDPKFPIEAAHDFRQDNLRDVAVATGMSYQDLSGDFQNLGFAAALMCQTPKQDYCKMRQRNFIDHPVRKTFREWLRASILAGVFDEKYPGADITIDNLEDYVQSATFKGKRWAFVNPLVQAQTLIILMEAGIVSPQQVQDQLPDGVSIEQLYTLFAEAKDEEQKHGLDFSNADVTRPTISKGEPGQTVPTPQNADGNAEDGEPAKPAKTKVANPVRVKNGDIRRTRIDPSVMALIDQQGDGTARNGH
jgi:capsid protein